MMNMTPRMKQIFEVLLREKEPISIKTLAEQVGVSKRTIQRELECLPYELKSYEVRFMSKTGVGIWLEGSSEEKTRLLEMVDAGDSYDASDREKRRKRLILEILKEKGLKKLFYYSSQFRVSEATISADLEAVESWLNLFELHVVRKPGSGVSIEGSEDNYRKAIRAFINENMDTQVVWDAYLDTAGSNLSVERLKKSQIGQLLNEDIMRRVMDCVAGMNHARVLTLTENSYIGLIIHLTIAINRILKNEVIEKDFRWQENQEQDEDYRLAMLLVKELEEEFEIEIPDVETSYICLHLKGSKHEHIMPKTGEDYDYGNREIQKLVNDMIDVFDPEKAYLIKQDEEFIQGLLTHLQPTMIRISHGMQIKNPVLEDIKNGYPEIFEKSLPVARVLEEYLGKKVPEEETGYLAVHFGAALVRLEEKREKIRRVQIGVVCSSGIGISRLMSSKIERTFRERVEIQTYGKNDITPFIAGKVDFFVTSISLEEMDTPVLSVNPLLNEEDMRNIQQMVYTYERMPAKQQKEDEFTLQLEKINLMAAQINTVIKHMDYFQIDQNTGLEELITCIARRMSPYLDRQEMICKDLMHRERISTQVFAEFGFALFHTRTKGVIRPCFGICKTMDQTPFRDPYFKEIDTVFVMLVPVDENLAVNNEILGYISSMLIEEIEFTEVVNRGEPSEIRRELSGHLKKFFKKYLSRLK